MNGRLLGKRILGKERRIFPKRRALRDRAAVSSQPERAALCGLVRLVSA